jgi:FtsJ-like methyltransferase
MLVFDISKSRGKKWRLPPIERWLNPQYNGEVDNYFGDDLEVNYPANWKADFAEFAKPIPELQQLKTELNEVKRTQDEITRNPQARRAFDRVVDLLRPQDALRGPQGILAQDFGAEVVTNAWLKMYELMLFVDQPLAALAKSRNKIFNSFHFAEAPGNFLLAVNHYTKTRFPDLTWNWLANSYYDVDSGPGSGYLSDQYGLIARFRDRWNFGADGDGDITSPANIRSFAQTKFGHQFHLMTSDVKFVPPDSDYDEEENINIPVHLGHVLCALNTLAIGGTAILKEFTFFETPSVALLYLLANCFSNVRLAKPETSRPSNSETYIVASGFQGLNDVQSARLMKIMEYIRGLNTREGSPGIFRLADIPREFVANIVDIEGKLAERQSKAIKHNTEQFHHYNEANSGNLKKMTAHILQDLERARAQKSEQWIARTEIKPLPKGDHLLG